MGVLLQGFYKRAANIAVPSPADGDPSIDWWWDHLARLAQELGRCGFTAIWLPPVLKTESGSSPAADGYGPFDDYDIGSKDQKGGIATRFGTREQLQRCVSVLRANGIDVYVDMVEHHRRGDTTPFVFDYPGSDGTPGTGRFAKNPGNFFPQVARDPNLGGAVSDDKPFGRELAPINGLPAHSVADNLTSAADWLTRALDIQGYRLDDVKGLSTDFLLPFLNSQSMAGKFAVGEFFDGNRTLVDNWVSNPKGMQGRASAFDFPLKFILTSMCNNPGRFNMASLDHAGLTGISPAKAVTFVENHDTDLDPTQRIVSNKIQAYAYILTSEGYPCVFYRDYSLDPGCYGLKPWIDNLIWIHERLASGPTVSRWKDFNVLAYERTGSPGLLVGINNDPIDAQSITVQTGFGPNVTLHDYTGHAGDIVTQEDGSVTLAVPPNSRNMGYVCYSRPGVGGGFAPAPKTVRQDFEGADDLDILPVQPGGDSIVGSIWVGVDQRVSALLVLDRGTWDATDIRIELNLIDPDNRIVATTSKVPTDPGDFQFAANSGRAGFYRLQIRAELPVAKGDPGVAIPFKLTVEYKSDPRFDPPRLAQEPATSGQWSELIQLGNVAIHAHLLPTGKVLYWGRREHPGDLTFSSLNEWKCFPFLFDPATRLSVAAAQPESPAGEPISLFCSSHTFLPDGRLLVTGGHIYDSQGINRSVIYNPFADRWTPGPDMAKGRWYPTVVTLADGSVLVCSGSYADPAPVAPPGKPANGTPTNNLPEHGIPSSWTPTSQSWTPLQDFNLATKQDLTLFPRIHLAPDGRLFMAGTTDQCFFFDASVPSGAWLPAPHRQGGPREYAPSVIYDVGKILYIGGGNNSGTLAPTDAVEMIDLTAAETKWTPTQSMHFPRRQHNATVLPDGTVLVTGGTRGPGFNDVSPGMPVHTAELWDPASESWTLLADESVDRCYHSTAVLLPDATVLSAGGGEYQPTASLTPNDPSETHTDAQIFSPPYLFRGPRPKILGGDRQVAYGQVFEVAYEAPPDGKVARASLVRLSSVTHSFNTNQRINFLDCEFLRDGVVNLTAPPNANVCPPGHYLLFLLSDRGVPSVAIFVQIIGNPKAEPRRAAEAFDPVAAGIAMRAAHGGQKPVGIGLTSTCPYGCWGNALTAAPRLEGVRYVLPVADSCEWMIHVYLDHEGLPDLDKWKEQIPALLLGSYTFRGVEVTLAGRVQADNGQLFLAGTDQRPAVRLAQMGEGDLVQRRTAGDGNQQKLTDEERRAYSEVRRLEQNPSVGRLSVTGPLIKDSDGYTLKGPRCRGCRRVIRGQAYRRKLSTASKRESALGETRTPMDFSTRTSSVRVCHFATSAGRGSISHEPNLSLKFNGRRERKFSKRGEIADRGMA